MNPDRALAPTLTLDDPTGVKTRQQAMWASGNFGEIGVRLQLVGETVCEAVDLRAGERVLDVAAGNGNASLAAARRYAEVTSTDYVPALLAQGRARAAAEGLPMTFTPADAEALPFERGAFDVALSTFGVMFAPDQPRAAAELLRVVRPGGRIGLACWTPEGFLGDLFRQIAAFVPPPAGVPSPLGWGSEPRLVELFGPSAVDLRTRRRHFDFRYRSPAHFLEVFEAYYGPVLKAFAALEPARRPALRAALHAVLERHDRGAGRSLVVPAEYLEIVVQR